MQKFITTTAIAALTLGLPIVAQAQSSYNNSGYAHQACKNKEDNRQILGGLAGAVVGGVFGSQVSGNGARTEGSAIGAVVGGLAGAGIADKMIDCDPVYESQTQTSSYPSYGTTSSYPASYQTTSSYPSNTAYADQVTYSNHPVYNEPSYGASYGTGAVTQGTTYSTGTTSYPTYQQPTYQQPTYQTAGYQSTSNYQTVPSAQVYNTSYSQSYTQPSTQTYSRTYAQPVRYVAPYRSTQQPRQQTGFHRHGSYGCSANH